jgi:hypothetical protein
VKFIIKLNQSCHMAYFGRGGWSLVCFHLRLFGSIDSYNFISFLVPVYIDLNCKMIADSLGFISYSVDDTEL